MLLANCSAKWGHGYELHLCQGVRINEGHEHGMAIVVHRTRHRQPPMLQGCHERKFLWVAHVLLSTTALPLDAD